MTELQKPITRAISGTLIQGREMCVRITKEGVYIKKAGERWTSAYLCPWEAVYSVGGKMKANENREQKAVRRVRRGLL